MSVAEKIAPHLPYLRRFARALSGTQERGDAYVLAVLEALIEDPSSFPAHRDARVGLYTCFLRVWNSISVNNGPAIPTESLADQRLEVLTPRPRQAFLLASVEGFTTQQVADILGCSRNDAVALVNRAGEEIAEQVATDVLIIEDEPSDLDGSRDAS